MGGKYPIVDFIVDVLDSTEKSIGFFFVQVKSTAAALSLSKTLHLDVDMHKFNKLATIPIPTFLIGVDTQTERAYVVAARRAILTAFSSITKKYDLIHDAVRVGLYKEVAQYWRMYKPGLLKARTQFANER